MSRTQLEVTRLLEERSLLTPSQARTFVVRRFRVPDGAQALRVRLAFSPARSRTYKNLLTISLFDPNGFRGAGHRHAPEQEIVLGPRGATPGFMPGALTPGDWVVEVDCHCVLPSPVGGVQYELIVDSVATEERASAWNLPVAEYLAAGKSTPAAPVEGAGGHIDVPEYEPDPPTAATPHGLATGARRWLKGDLHVHTLHSDGRWSVDDVVRYVEQAQLDFIATTDHNTTSAFDDVQWALERAGRGTVVIPAMELTTFWGHANALGVDEWIDWRVRGPEGQPRTIGDSADAPPAGSMERAAARVRELGGTFVVNHPRSAGYPACTGCRWELGDATATYADAIEVWNGPWDRTQNHEGLALWNRWLNAGHRIPATAGTDSHEWPHHFDQMGYTYVFASPETGDILSAVREGSSRSFVSSGPLLTWRVHDGSTQGPAVHLTGFARPAELRTVVNGQPAGTQRVDGDGDITLPSSATETGARWVRAELWQPDSTKLLAMANPVWLT